MPARCPESLARLCTGRLGLERTGADYGRATLERVEIAGTGTGMSPHDVVRAVRRALPAR